MTIDVRRTKSSPVVPILVNGMLSKRSPKSLVGLHAWQQRYFELSPGRITYYEFIEVYPPLPSPPVLIPEERGFMALGDLAGVREDRGNERRFDLLMANKRLFQLAAPDKPQRDIWVKSVQAALIAALSAKAAGTSLEPTSTKDTAAPSVTAARLKSACMPYTRADGARDSPAALLAGPDAGRGRRRILIRSIPIRSIPHPLDPHPLDPHPLDPLCTIPFSRSHLWQAPDEDPEQSMREESDELPEEAPDVPAPVPIKEGDKDLFWRL